MRVGIVGLGSISKYWINALESNKDVALVALCDAVNRDATKYPFYEKLDQMLEKEQIDIVLVSTPPSTHLELVRTALLQKKHVIVEKPFSTTLNDLEVCVELAQQNNVILYLAYHSMFGETFLKAKEFILEQLSTGDKIISTTAQCEDDVTKYHSGHSWIFDPAVSGGGALIDCGINILSMLLDILGPLEIESVSIMTPEGYKVERIVDCKFLTKENKPCTMFYDWLSKNTAAGFHTFEFESGISIQYEWITRTIKKLKNGKEEFSMVINSGESDSNIVPMSQEYITMLEDALKHIRKEKTQHLNCDAFYLTMKCYEKATRK